MSKPRLLDLFCGAGGCTKGYQRAGFYVVGVDNRPQPHYCGDEFFQADALEFINAPLWTKIHFDAIHASPPCQRFSAMSNCIPRLAEGYPNLIEPMRVLLRGSGLPWVMENVEGSPVARQDTLDGSYGVELCGTQFGLTVWRHRLFETSFPIHPPALSCNHSRPAMNPHNGRGRKRIYAELGRSDPEKPWRKEMGVEWMGRYEAREAIPPVYTQFIGEQLLQHLGR